MIDADRAMDYVEFVTERHRVWEARQRGDRQPWTANPVLRERKFTNVFRVLDPGSQYILQLTDGVEGEDFLLRCFLYRHTGRLDAWEYLDLTCGLPTRDNLDDVLEAWRTFRGEPKVRTRNVDPRAPQRTTQTDYVRSVFTGAYLVFPQSQVAGTDKLESIVDLARRTFVTSRRTWTDFHAARSQAERFAAIRTNKGVGDFMSMQTLTDWGYTTEDRENDFVVPGPGAIKGATALGLKPMDAVRWAHETLGKLSISLEMPDGRRRSPSLMDAQNTLCEFSKYVRFLEKPPTGQHYRPAHPGPQPAPWIPTTW